MYDHSPVTLICTYPNGENVTDFAAFLLLFFFVGSLRYFPLKRTHFSKRQLEKKSNSTIENGWHCVSTSECDWGERGFFAFLEAEKCDRFLILIRYPFDIHVEWPKESQEFECLARFTKITTNFVSNLFFGIDQRNCHHKCTDKKKKKTAEKETKNQNQFSSEISA